MMPLTQAPRGAADEQFDRNMLRQCYAEAARWSTDPVTWNAAIILRPDGRVVTSAANTLAAGVEARPERLVRPEKYRFFGHAERRAIYRAARDGFPTRGCTLYCPWAACSACAIAIIESGIRTVVAHAAPFHVVREDWRPDLEAAAAMFAEAGVKVRSVEGKIGDVSIRFDGNVVWP
jgi:deoxycytidylate deaminase